MFPTCLRDPMQQRLTTRAISCTPKEDGWAVVLEDTVLYPEGGGQPADRGTIAGIDVSDVQRGAHGIVHTTARPVPLGPVEVVVDWGRRLDHMQQHTGQHLLSAIAEDRLGWRTTAFHLPVLAPAEGPAHARPPVVICDVELDVAAPTGDELARLEGWVNEAIREARPVGIRVVPRAELAGLPVRTRGVPEGIEAVRLIEIEGIDLNTCGGTHLRSTAGIGGLVLVGHERMRGGTRLRFLAGGRIAAHVHAEAQRTEAIGRLLSAGAQELVDAVERVLASRKAAERAAKAQAAELAQVLGDSLAERPGAVAALHRPDGDAGFLAAVARAALGRRGDLLVVLTSGEPDGVFLVAGPPDRVAEVRETALDLLEGRGGGRPGWLQGRAARLDRREELLRQLHRPGRVE